MKSYNFFIKESNEVDDLIKILESKCGPFIEALGGCDDELLFYRGHRPYSHNELLDVPYLILKHNWNRTPLDTPLEIHETYDDLFKKKFGWYVRSGCFATKNDGHARSYGTPYLFFPIGSFNFAWSKYVEDFFQEIENSFIYLFGWDYENYLSMTRDDRDEWYKDMDMEGLTEYEFYDKCAKEADTLVNSYTENNLCKVQSQEVSFDCDEYLLVSTKYRSELEKFIWG